MGNLHLVWDLVHQEQCQLETFPSTRLMTIGLQAQQHHKYNNLQIGLLNLLDKWEQALHNGVDHPTGIRFIPFDLFSNDNHFNRDGRHCTMGWIIQLELDSFLLIYSRMTTISIEMAG